VIKVLLITYKKIKQKKEFKGFELGMAMHEEVPLGIFFTIIRTREFTYKI
jgi:hypothetical protein